jgi:hypothetical protein
VLLNLKDNVLVNELIGKTRDGGLPWKINSNGHFQVDLCQTSHCIEPLEPTNSWSFHVVRNMDASSNYIYHLEIQYQNLPFISLNSRDIDFVETLYHQIEETQTPLCERKIRRAIRFMSKIPTSPRSDTFDHIMCGGVEVGGTAFVTLVQYIPPTQLAQVSVTGYSTNQFIIFPPTGGGVSVGGSAEYKVWFKDAGVTVSGDSPINVTLNASTNIESDPQNLFQGMIIKPGQSILSTSSLSDGNGMIIKEAKANLNNNNSIQATPIVSYNAVSSIKNVSHNNSNASLIARGQFWNLANSSITARWGNIHKSSTTISSSTSINGVGRIFGPFGDCLTEYAQNLPESAFPLYWTLQISNISYGDCFGCYNMNGYFTLAWNMGTCSWRCEQNGVAWELSPTGNYLTGSYFSLTGQVIPNTSTCLDAKVLTDYHDLPFYNADQPVYIFPATTSGDCVNTSPGSYNGTLTPIPPYFKA